MSHRIIYLHGFNSSPSSYKAQALLARMESAGRRGDVVVPTLSPYPEEAIQQCCSLVEEHMREATVGLIGSSLGGYYATWLSDRYRLRAVLINPSVRPYDTLEAYLGENKNYYNEQRWCFDRSHIQQLRDHEVMSLMHPEDLMVLLQKGDEVLDYRQAEEKFADSTMIIEQGGDHSFIGFEDHLPAMLSFLETGRAL